MWVEPRRIYADEARAIGEEMRLDPDDVTALVEAVGQSDPAMVLTYDSRPFVTCGFIPLGVLSDSAYAWMQWTPEIYDRPVASTRMCVQVFTEARTRYRRIFGHCSFGPRPERLLRRLGARFSVDPADGRPCYVIGDEL